MAIIKRSIIPETSASIVSSVLVTVTNEVYAKIVDETYDPILYIGEAAVGSATSSPVWRIQKVDTTSGTIITWADGNSLFDNVWDDHATTQIYL
jgi:hypothetical protein